ncbi:MAG TPA: hypothetical protein VFO79_05500, partial [Xanthomonadales bacterium]|nr:hypothetical protein [Xanthomonadales bacterium]
TALAALFFAAGSLPMSRAPSMLAPNAPQQTLVAGHREPFRKASYWIHPLADFSVEARVLARRDYDRDREAEIAPVDLTLGWGRMSDSAVLDDVRISLSDRWWHWYSPNLPIPIEEINRSAANMHIVPANDYVRRQLDQVRAGHVVTLRGYLVEARGAHGYAWRSSLTRGDVGEGSCEIVWVEQLTVR